MKIEDIKYKKHQFETVEWFKNDGTFLDKIENEHDFNNLRIELVKNNLTQDCYFMWNDKKITLDDEGNMSSFPRGLYDHLNVAMAELFKLRNGITLSSDS
jgi:hypothetical protein